MSIQYGPGYDPLDQPGNSGSGFPVVSTWDDLASREPSEIGDTVRVTNIPGASNVSILARRGVTKWEVPGSQATAGTHVMNNPIPNNAPTSPKRRRILGRSSTSQDGIFESSGNNAGWWAYGVYSVAGPTRISIDTRISNQTGKDVARISIPFLGLHNNNANIIAVWIGRGGNTHWCDSFQRMTFSGQNTKQLAVGTDTNPSIGVTDTLLLDTPWLADTEILIRVVFENSGQIESFDSFGTNQNFDSGLSRCWVGLGDAGSTTELLSNSQNLQWRADWNAPFCNVFVEFAEYEIPEVSVLVYGDSVVNQFKSFLDTLSACRDGWQYYLEQLVTSNTWHVATAGNGGYTVIQYGDRLLALLETYAPWIDVVCFQAWTPNGSITTTQDLQAWQTKINQVHDAVIALNKGWLVQFNSPIGDDKDFPEIGASIHARQLDMVAWCNEQFTGHVIDMRSSLTDPQNPDYFAPGMSLDSAHHTKMAAPIWANDVKPLFEARLTQTLKYSI